MKTFAACSGSNMLDADLSDDFASSKEKSRLWFQSPEATPKTPSARPDEIYGVASPSPSMLNPMTEEDWDESTSRSHVFCPRLDSIGNDDGLIRRLQTGFEVVFHDEDGNMDQKSISLTGDRQFVRIVDANSNGISQLELQLESCELDRAAMFSHTLLQVSNIERVETGSLSSPGSKLCMGSGAHPLTCFSLLLKKPVETYWKMDFEAASILEREAIVSALLLLVGGETTLSPMRRTASAPNLASLKSILQIRPVEQDLSCYTIEEISTPACGTLSLSKRTRIHSTQEIPRDESRDSIEEGTELSLVDHRNIDLELNESSDDTAVTVLEGSEGLEFGRSGSMFIDDPSLGDWCVDNHCTLGLNEIAACFQGAFEALETDEQTRTERNIETALPVNKVADDLEASSGDVLCGGAPLFMFFDGSQAENDYATGEPPSVSDRANRRRRNRAGVFRAQTRRWQQLRNEMTFSSVAESSRKKMHVIQTTKSLDDLDNLVMAKSKVRSSDLETDRKSSEGILDAIFGLGLDRPKNDEKALFYDSDPGESRVSAFRRGPRVVDAMRSNQRGSKDWRKAMRNKRIRFKAFQKSGRKKISERQANEILQIMKSDQIHLLWHRKPSSRRPNTSPLCVNAWIERGAYFSKKSFIQPKLMWKAAFEKDLEGRQLNVAMDNPDRFDLIEVRRIQDSPKIDRKDFPLANRRRCFAIETRSCVHLFEAESAQEKKRIVFGLKLTVARLASLLALRDPRVVEEFFEPVDSVVPGKPPRWTETGTIHEENIIRRTASASS